MEVDTDTDFTVSLSRQNLLRSPITYQNFSPLQSSSPVENDDFYDRLNKISSESLP